MTADKTLTTGALAPAAMPTRRGVLRQAAAAVAGGAALSFGMPFIARAQSDPFKIGMLLAKTGTATEQGEYLSKGTMLALEQAGGTLLGRPCEVVWLDDPDAQTGQQNMLKLIDEEGVIAVVGGSTSSTALAESAVAQQRKIPFFANTAAARQVTGENCSRYTFRIKASGPVFGRALTPYLTTFGKNWYFLTASYAYGQDIYNSMSAELAAAGGTVVASDETPVGTIDFSSFLLKIHQAQPDVVVAGVPASDLSNFLKQYAEIGLAGRIPVANPGVATTDMWSVGPGVLTGIYATEWYYKDPMNSPEDQQFTADFMAKHGTPPADGAWMGWASMRMLLQAIETAGSPEPRGIIENLEAMQFPDGTMPAYIRPWDHQVVRRFLVVGAKETWGDQWDCFDILKHAPETPEELEPLYGTPEEVGCTMGDI